MRPPRLLVGITETAILYLLIIAADTQGFPMAPNDAPWRERVRARGGSLCAIGETTSLETSSPKLSFGVIADIQYAPIADGASYGGVPRYYRHALSAARHAAEHFQKEKVDIVVNLGDIVDGKCQEIEQTADIMDGKCQETEQTAATKSKNPGIRAIRDVLSALSAYTHGDLLHTYGNHELYNVNRNELGELLSIPFFSEPCGEQVGYRSHLVQKDGTRLRFVIIDTYDIAVGGRCETSSNKRKLAEALLFENNPNFALGNENSPEGLEGLKRRYVAFNGGVGEIQMQWLRDTLEASKESDEKVIVLSHQPLYPDSSNAVCLAWNYDEILDLLKEYSDTVIASFSGHAHRGGYKRCEDSGIHFRVFEAALESPDPIKTYALVDVYDDRIEVRGSGDCESAVYFLDHMK